MSDDERVVELHNQGPDLNEDFGEKEWPFGGKGGLDEIPVPTGAACIKISTILGRASEHPGYFSFGGQADQLPASPGIFVDGVGPVPVPLWEERAHRLIEKCTKSPFGHNMDEKVRKSWELQPDQVQFKNPQWQVGIEKMAVTIAERLGYQDISLHCVLSKLVVCGVGGHYRKHQDTEKENGVIATLVVQPPSLHEGGNLLVRRYDEVKHCHDFGKAAGTATSLPHFAVHYAGAAHTLNRVTRGYRLALVYSVRLPADKWHLERNPFRPMDGELAEAIETMASGDDNFALLLNHENTQNYIRWFGSGADRARGLALGKANSSVSAEKKLQFYLVELRYQTAFCGIGDDKSRQEKAIWYSDYGSWVGPGDKVDLKLNFLNPCRETHSQRWKKSFGSSGERVYTGNERRRYAIVAWPMADDAENAVKFVNIEQAAKILAKLPSMDTAKLRKFMDAADAKLAILDARDKECQANPRHRQEKFMPVEALWALCQALSKLVENADDSTLVTLFFTNFFRRMIATWDGRIPWGAVTVSEKMLCVQHIVAILERFEWRDVGQGLLLALAGTNNKEVATTALAIARRLTRRDAQQSLLVLAVEKAVKLDDETLSSFTSLETLWDLVFSRGNESMFQTLASNFQQMSPRLLPPAIKTFSCVLCDTGFPVERKAVLACILACRSEWLASQIRVLEKPFSWEMPAAEFADFPQLEIFLRSSEEKMTTEGMLPSEDELRNIDKLYSMRNAQIEASFRMSRDGTGEELQISKTRLWYDESQAELPQMRKEVVDLRATIAETLVNVISTGGEVATS